MSKKQSEANETEQYRAGMQARREVLGDAHVDMSVRRTTAFDAPFQTFITEGAWGSVWSRPGLTRRERSMITIALLAGLGHDEEVAMHVRATPTPARRRGYPAKRCCMLPSMPACRPPTAHSRSPSRRFDTRE
jgi:hypothetical protein